MIAHKCDLNHVNALPLMPTEFSSLFKRLLWSALSKFSLRRNRVVRILPFFSVFDRKWRFEIGLQLTNYFRSSFMRGLITASLKVFGTSIKIN